MSAGTDWLGWSIMMVRSIKAGQDEPAQYQSIRQVRTRHVSLRVGMDKPGSQKKQAKTRHRDGV